MKKSRITQTWAPLVLLVSVMTPHWASARSGFLEAFTAEYPAVVGTRLDSCNVCHTNVPRRNSYGNDFNLAGRRFSSIESVDSDGDGASNLTEIMSLTFPGDASDRPGAPTATPTPTPSPTRTIVAGSCDGDCDGNGVVAVNELLVAVNIALGTAGAEACSAVDLNGDDQVTIDELLRAVSAALNGCAQ